MLVRIAEGRDVPGSKPADYGVILGSVTDEAERHWAYFKGLWRELRKQLPTAADGTPTPDHTGTPPNRRVLPLLNEREFGLLPEVGGDGLVADDDPEKVFALSHRWQHVPIHVPTWAADLDKRPGGAGTTPPQSLVQEALNRTSDHLWAVVTNGRQLRLLRDSSALATAAYVEFDLEAIVDGELFNEFVLLDQMLPAPRSQPAEAAPWTSCARGCRKPSPSWAPASSNTRPTRICARTWTPRPCTAHCCAWSTGCCSCSWPRTEAPCTRPAPTSRPSSVTPPTSRR